MLGAAGGAGLKFAADSYAVGASKGFNVKTKGGEQLLRGMNGSEGAWSHFGSGLTDEKGKAFIKHERDCWGCTSCLKECRFEAINFFLGADVGGKGSTLSFRQNGSINTWTVTSPDGTVKTLEVNRQESNKY
jgi:adenylylsulfate reductase subunit B